MDRLWAMEVLIRVVECGSFSRAAASLDLANATVTACVRNLEKHLGVTLIERNTRYLRLTDEGTIFVAQCHGILQSVERAEAGIRTQIGQMRGLLRVEVPISIGHALICPVLSEFAQRHPETSVAVTLTNQPHNLIERAIDIAIRMDRVEDGDLIAKPIYEARYVVCGIPALVKRAAAHPGELNPRLCLGLLHEGEQNAADWTLTKGKQRAVIRPQGPLHFNSSDGLVTAALKGAGIIHVLDIFANRHIADGELAEAYADWTTGTKAFYAVTSKSRIASARIRVFIDFLLETLAAQRRPSAIKPVKVGRL